MPLLLVSLFAGMLTALAPCVLPVLPVVLGSSAAGRSKATPYVVVGSLAASVILFTYLLKASTAFIMVPPAFWTLLSGGILVGFGLIMLFPTLWERLPGVSRASGAAGQALGTSFQKKTLWGDMLAGAALGPVFSTCSPTYFVILASVLPASFALGTLYLLAYVAGLSTVLLLVAVLGQRLTRRLGALSDPHGRFKRGIGALFVLLGFLIATGTEKKIEAALVSGGIFDITKVEQKLLEASPMPAEDLAAGDELLRLTVPGLPAPKGAPYTEIVRPSGFVNTDGITMKELVGKKVILVDFLTYSCINCQRTFPYLNAWYDKYRDQGLEIIGIHTPEFAFEKDIGNVRKAMARFGIRHPIVLDNDYATWNAYGNRYWPRKYLVDIHGNVVYDHIGEGGYEETEMKIRELLEERARVLGEQAADMGGGLAADALQETRVAAQSPETYFGTLRNEFLANGESGRVGEQSFDAPDAPQKNALYLGGQWTVAPEYAEASAGGAIIYRYAAGDVYIVADATALVVVEVWQDGKPVGAAAGADVQADGTVRIQESRLYRLIHNAEPGEHVLELRIRGKGARFYAFTFG